MATNDAVDDRIYRVAYESGRKSINRTSRCHTTLFWPQFEPLSSSTKTITTTVTTTLIITPIMPEKWLT